MDGPVREAPMLCPHCEQVTMPNRLADGTRVCSCPAERPLPASGPPAGT